MPIHRLCVLWSKPVAFSIRLMLMICFFASLPAAAQFTGEQQRGFSPNQVYQVGDLDSVNILNGDVIIRIPLGQEYAVGPSLRYQFILTYNSKVWEHGFGVPGPPDQDQRYAYPEKRSNAGFGWLLTLGQLVYKYPRHPDAEPWMYLAPDGSEYHFQSPHNPADQIDPTVLYAYSGRYLRMRRDKNAALYPYKIDFPNGETHTFDRDGNLFEMRDQYGNWVQINGYDTSQVTVTDGHGIGAGSITRTHHINFENLLPTRYPDQPNFVRRIVGLDLAAFDGQRANYTFAYTDDVLIGYGGGAPTHPKPCVKGPVLKSVELPDESKYEATYYEIPAADCAYNVLNDDFGAIKKLTRPTGGSIEWLYGSYTMNQQFCYSPVIGWDNGFNGVTKRTFKDHTGAVVGEWTYAPDLVRNNFSYTGKICGSDPSVVTVYGPSEEFVNIVESPDGLVTKHYFSAWPEEAYHGVISPNGFSGYQFGLPISAMPAKRDSEGRFISTEVYDCSGGCARGSFNRIILPAQPIRRTYLSYGRPTLLHNGSPWAGPGREFPWVVTSQRNELEIDATGTGAYYVDTDYSQHDGYGQFQQTTTTSNFSGVQTRTSRVVRQRTIDDDTWILDQNRETSVQDGEGPELKLFEACWENGFMTRRRIFRGLADQDDFLSVYEPNTRGNVATERHHSVPPTFDACGGTEPATPVTAMTHEWSYGSLASSQYVGVDHKSKDLTVDSSTGLAITSRDGNNRETVYDYDALGRLKTVKPPAETESVYDYFVDQRPVHVVAKQQLPNASTTETESHYYYDGLGRLIQEKRRMPLGWATVSHTYDASGRKASVTVPTYTTTSDYSAPSQIPSTVHSYDILGRPTKVVAPDLSVVETHYVGDREVSRDSKVATTAGVTTNQTLFRTTEVYDGFGRLVEVREPLPNGSSTFTSTSYTYDFGDRLLSVLNGQNPRTFEYDRAGNLLSDTHPERGTGTYTYDARGRLLTKKIGTSISLLNVYDAAERLTHVLDQKEGDRPLKIFTYDTKDTVVERGKLVEQTRYNYFPDATYVVSDRFQYQAATGRLASKETEVQTPTGTKKATQQYTYNSVGQPAAINFPVCSACTGSPSQPRTLPLTWQDGLLTSISSAATAIDYAASGATTRVVHATNDPGAANGVVDEYEQDASGLTRPTRIKFANVRDCSLILRHPLSASIPESAAATFSLETAPGATVQWYQGVSGDTNNPIQNATGLSYTTPVLLQTTSYWARVTAAGGGCREDTLTVTATFCAAPVINTPAATVSRQVYAGDPLQFSVNVTGTVSYAWFKRVRGTTAKTAIGSTSAEVSYTPEIGAPGSLLEIGVTIESVCGTVHYEVERVVAILDVVSKPPCVAEFDPVATSVFLWSHTILPNELKLLEARLRMAASSEAERTALDTTYPKRRYSFRWYEAGQLEQSTDAIWKVNVTEPPDAASASYHFRFVNQSWARVEAWVSCYDSVDADEQTPVAVSAMVSKQTYGVMNGHCPTPEVTVASLDVVLGSPREVVLEADTPYPHAIFQWYEGESGNTINEAFNGTASSLTVTDVGTYWVRVSSPCGKYTDSPTIRVSDDRCQPVRILRDPVGATIAAGTMVTLSVDAASIPTPNYYLWHEAANGAATTDHPINESNGKKSITVAPLETTDYYVRVGNGTVYKNDCSLINSRIARVHVTSCGNNDIVIVTQPQDVLLSATDQSVVLAVQASADAALKYQWYIGESGDMSRPIEIGGNSSSVLLTWQDHLSQPDGNKFWVKVSFVTAPGAPKRCAVDSRTVNICRLPRIHNPLSPVYSNSVPHQERVLGFGATGDGLTYQWYEGDGNLPIPDESHPLASHSDAMRVYPNTTTKYWVKIQSSCAPANVWTKQTTEVSVCPNFDDPMPAASKTLVNSGETITLTVDVDRGDLIEWYMRVGTAAPVKFAQGADPTVTTPQITQQTKFFARAISGICSRDSEEITISLCTSPTIHWSSGNPTRIAKAETFWLNTGLAPGETANFKWYRGATVGDVAGSTLTYQSSNAYQVANLQATASFWVRALNEQTGCYSDTATVHTVNVCIPTILSQPQSVTINSGTSTTLTVTTDDLPGVTYQWYIGQPGDTSNLLDGKTSSTLTVSPAVTTTYWVRVTGCPSPLTPITRDSQAATVTICQVPAITTQPASSWQTNPPTTLSVTATGTELTYQWYKGLSGDVSLPQSSTASTMNVSPTVTTNYWVRISGRCGTPISSVTAKVSVKPSISSQPAGGLIMSGTTQPMSVTASGTELTYQWYQRPASGSPTLIAGATNASYTPPAMTADSTFYVRVYSGTAYTDSSDAVFTMCTSPNVHWSSGNPTRIAKGEAFWLNIGLGAGETATPNWYRGTTSGDVAGSTLVYSSSGAYQVANLQTTTSYWVRALNQTTGCYSDTTVHTVNVCIPTILAEPQSITINNGTSTTLTVTTDNLPGVTYQWYTGQPGDVTNPLTGKTSNTLTVSPTATTTYWVRVTGCPSPLTPVSRNSVAATVTICQIPAITTQPSGNWQTSPPTTLSVTATGTELTYQWYKGLTGDTSLPQSSTTSSMVVSPTVTTNYWVRVSGRCGTPLNSVTAKVSVKPSINSQPAAGPITKGTTRAMTVTASGTELTYQWYQRPASGSPILISGATNASYTPPAIMANATYYVRVYSGIAYLDSTDATFTVCLPREINVVGYPSGQSGAQITLTVQDPAADEQYEWYRGAAGNTSDPLGSGTTKYLNPTATTTYWLRTKRSGCDADSAPVTINICYPNITAQPEASSLIASGTTKTLSVTVTGTAPLVYQWYQGAVGVTTTPVGTNSNIFTTPALTANTSYWVRISTNAAACATKFVNSQLATVNVCQPPVITAQPQPSNQLPVGLTYTISVTATGDNLHYQWYIGDAGVTTTPVGTDSNQISVTANQTKKYWVRVTGTCGVVNSVAALQSVKPRITAQPQTADVCGLGGTATFSVSANGADGYKWYRDWDLVGTERILTIPVTDPSADYRVVVTSGDASATSITVGVNMLPVPTVNNFTATQETATRWLLQTTIAAADQGLVRYKFYEGALGDTTTLLTDTATYYYRVYPSSRPRTYWVSVYYTDTGCATNRAVTIP